MRIVLIGAGRLASHLAPALRQAGHDIVQVYSRTITSARSLSEQVGAQPTDDVQQVQTDADVFIFSVTDTALPMLIAQLGVESRRKALFLHTAGSVPLSVFEGYAQRYGVIYPMQTFSKGRQVDFSKIPVFVEGNNEETLKEVSLLAASVSAEVTELSTEGRRHLHLAAVFACNFANHCYQLSAEILSHYGLPFRLMLPLIDETAAKVHELQPLEAQTGPAVRYDENVLNAQKQLLAADPLRADLYDLMSRSIHQSHMLSSELQNF